MKTLKILTRAEYLKEYFKALIKDDYMQLDILKKANIFSKYFIFLRCEKCSALPVVITEKDVKAELAYSGYILYLYAKCPNCGENFILDEDNVAHECPSAYKYFHKKAFKSRGNKKLREDVVVKLQKNIRKNWGEVIPFRQIRKKNFNCYMFAICCTKPTEIIIFKSFWVSIIREDIPYFGAIGHISGTPYNTLEEYKQAFINDLNVLGISAEERFEDFTVTGKDIKIAFYSNFEEGIAKEDEQFHFLRFIPSKNCWMGKAGFPGGFQELKRGSSIEEIQVLDQKRIGLYRLSLISKSTSKFSDEMN